MYIKARRIGDVEKATLTKQDKSSAILEKLRERAEQIGYGSIVCEIQIHDGEIKQVDITTVKERMRAD